VEEVQDLELIGEMYIPPILSMQDVVEIYASEVYKYCGFNTKYACMILEINEKQLVKLLEDYDYELDFS